MADSNSTSVKPTADLSTVACVLNSNGSQLAGLAHLLHMLMLDHGHDQHLTASLTALAGVAERASSDCLAAGATLENIEAQTKEVHHVKLNASDQFAGIVDEFESCSRILDSIQQIAASIENGSDHIALAHAINYIATDYQGHLSNVAEKLKADGAI